MVEKQRNKLTKDGIILDFGSGRGRNTKYLRNLGYTVIAYEPFPNENIDYEVITELNEIDLKSVDTVILSYILNILPKDERNKVLEQINQIPSWNLILVSVRGYQIDDFAKENGWKLVEPKHLELGSGYITKHNTFQKGYDCRELISELRKNIGRPMMILSAYTCSDQRVEVIGTQW